jgi:hypothetical protein
MKLFEKYKWLLFAVAIMLVSMFYRRPDPFYNAHFWAEEGLVFYSEAFNQGWSSMFNTCVGYFHLYPRLIANASVQFGVPLHITPFLYTFSCLVIHFLLLIYIWKRLPFSELQRFFIAITIVMIPLQAEVFMNLTNIQWLMVFFPLIIFSQNKFSNTPAIITLDSIILVFSAFTGPNFVVLLPLFIVFLFVKIKQKPLQMASLIALILAVCAGIIGLYYLKLHGSVSRTEGVFVLGNKGFVQYLFVQFYYIVIGKFAYKIPLILMLLGLVLVLIFYAVLIKWLWKSKNRSFEWIVIACNLLFIGTTLVAYRTEPELLSPYYRGVRNFYIPTVTFVWLFIRYVEDWKFSKLIVSGLMILFTIETIVFVGRFRVINAPDLSIYSGKLKEQEEVQVPIFPEGWVMKLEKENK